MTRLTLTKIRLFSLFACFGILTAALTMTRSAQAGFVQNEENYWNMGDFVLPISMFCRSPKHHTGPHHFGPGR